MSELDKYIVVVECDPGQRHLLRRWLTDRRWKMRMYDQVDLAAEYMTAYYETVDLLVFNPACSPNECQLLLNFLDEMQWEGKILALPPSRPFSTDGFLKPWSQIHVLQRELSSVKIKAVVEMILSIDPPRMEDDS